MKTLLVLAVVLAGPRNIFKYVEEPRPPKKKAAVAAPAPVVVTPAPSVVERIPPPPPPSFDFPYRYIGLFGPEANPIAVFVGESVVTARAGDVVGDAILIREIGVDRVIVSRGEIAKIVALSE